MATLDGTYEEMIVTFEHNDLTNKPQLLIFMPAFRAKAPLGHPVILLSLIFISSKLYVPRESCG